MSFRTEIVRGKCGRHVVFGKTICVVDDDDDVRHSTCTLLESCGYSAEGYASATGFLERTGDRAVGCIVLDLQMPGMSGLALLEYLRAMGDATPVIVLTGNGSDLEKLLLQKGAIAMLRKPVAIDDLLEWVQRVCP